MHRIRAIIFDFDGTLTELTLDFQAVRESIIAIARRYLTEEVIRTLNGQHIIETIYGLEKVMGLRGSAFKDEAFAKLTSLEVEAAQGKDVYPYTRGVLKRLKEMGLRAGIMTRNCMDALSAVFPDVGEYAETVVTREHVRDVKPDPAHIREVLLRLAVAPYEAMVAGDHPTDVMAGRALGMKTIGLLTGRTTREAFEQGEATYILNDIREILSLPGMPSPPENPRQEA
jgi:phosphoglycolate phosphatase